MEWTDSGVLLSTQRHGESRAIATFLTQNHGRHAGIVRISKKLTTMLQPGTQATVTWKARLSEHLGTWTIETSHCHWVKSFHNPLALTTMTAACAWVEILLPERDPLSEVFEGLQNLLTKLEEPNLLQRYILFELKLLQSIGFGLSLNKCAVTGQQSNLAYVSPRTGRAVTRTVGEPYRERLLPLAQFITQPEITADAQQLQDGLKLTGYFLERFALANTHKHPPIMRQRLQNYSLTH